MSEHSLIRRLKERKMVQWAIAYGAGALVLLEIADFLAEAFDWPMMTLRIITVVVGFAFLGVLVIAWYHGEQGHQRVKTTEALLLAAIALAGGGTAWWVGARAVAATPATPASADPPASRDGTLLTSSMQPSDGRKGVAVLPFLSIGAGEDRESFADGITEDIIAEIASAEGLRVISRTSVMQYRGTSKSIPEIGRELGVDVILEGSVRRAGDEVRIVAQLIDAHTDEHLWQTTYDRNIKDILQVQTDVARDIALQLRERLGLEVQLAAAGDRPEVDPQAFEQVVEGRKLASSEQPEERQRGVQMLVDAVSRDSNLVRVALPALAEFTSPEADPMAAFDAPPVPPDPAMTEAVQRAMRHAPTAPAARTFSIRRAVDAADFARAEETARQAIEENPNNSAAHRYYGLLLGRHGDYAGAIEHLREAVRLDPHSPTPATDLGEMLYAAGRYDAAEAQLKRVIERHESYVPARVALGLTLQAEGQHAAAVAQLRQAVEQSHGNPMVMGSLGYVFAAQGAVEQAHAVIDSLRLKVPDTRGMTGVAIAQVLNGLGDLEAAARSLEEAGSTAEGDRDFRFRWMSMDPKLRKLFADSIVIPTGGQTRRTPR